MGHWTYAAAAVIAALGTPQMPATSPLDTGVALPPIPAGKALLVLYRTGGIKGVLLSCSVREGDDVLAHLAPSRYASTILEPGVHQLNVAGRGALAVTAAADEVQFVRCKVGGALMASPPHLEASDREAFRHAAPSLKPSTP